MPLFHPINNNVLFTDDEMRSKGNGEIRLAPGFGDRLVKLRIAFQHPMLVTSFCRDPDHNEREGGHPSSAHLTLNSRWNDTEGFPLGTFGLDVVIPGSKYRASLVLAALKLDWCVGINYAKGFVHLDQRLVYTDKTDQVLFVY